MKTLTDILGDRMASGVYLLAGDAPLAQLEEPAIQRGFECFHLSGSEAKNKAQFLAHAAQTLKFPEYFGHNWDSLEECLTDMSWHEAPAYLIVFEEFEKFADGSPGDFETALEIFRDAAETWRKEGKAWYLVLRGKPREQWGLTELQL
ncbi:MAG: barstar family protein [Thermodesulfobacteriota bacterium]